MNIQLINDLKQISTEIIKLSLAETNLELTQTEKVEFVNANATISVLSEYIQKNTLFTV